MEELSVLFRATFTSRQHDQNLLLSRVAAIVEPLVSSVGCVSYHDITACRMKTLRLQARSVGGRDPAV